MYERDENLQLRDVIKTQYIGACTPPAGGNNPIDPRFMTLFSCINVTFPTQSATQGIYTKIIEKHLQARDYPEEIWSEISSKMTQATIKLYDEIKLKLPRTPLKFHYIFNLRDLSRVYEGVALSTIDKFSKKEDLIRLWRNECMRVFIDRLVTEEDREFIVDEMKGLVAHFFPGTEEKVLLDPLLYADFILADPLDDESEDPRLYEDLKDYGTVRIKLEKMLEDYAYDH
jgi:dynein heavy chain